MTQTILATQFGATLHALSAALPTNLNVLTATPPHPTWLVMQFGAAFAAVWFALQRVSLAAGMKLWTIMGAKLSIVFNMLRALTVQDVEAFIRRFDAWMGVAGKLIEVVVWRLVSVGGAFLAACYLAKWLGK